MCVMRRAFAAVVVLIAGAPWWLSAQQQRPTVLSRLIWFDRNGARLNGIGPVADHGNLELSPDGTRVAVAVARRAGEPRDLWIYDTNTGARTQFTSEPSDENWLAGCGAGRGGVRND